MPADLIARAHDAGILCIQQVMDRRQAEQALAAGADVVVAQGGEAGGHSGWVDTMVPVPQVVDLAGDVPVAAALASAPRPSPWAPASWPAGEMRIAEEWKRRIVAAEILRRVVEEAEATLCRAAEPAQASGQGWLGQVFS